MEKPNPETEEVEIFDVSDEGQTICYACGEQHSAEFGLLVCLACLDEEADFVIEEIENDKS